MAEKTNISWTDNTFNTHCGCTKMKHSQPPPEDESLRPPIANEECERYCLGACMVNPKHADAVIDQLTPADFSVNRHKLIYDCVKNLRALRLDVDRVMLAEQLLSRGQLEAVGLAYLADLDTNMPALASVAGYIAIVKEKAALRRVVDVAQDVIQQAYSGSESKEVVKSFDKNLYKLVPDAAKGRVTRLGDYIEQNYGELIQPSAHRGKGIYTGFIRLDELTGGMFPTEIWLWGAAPGVGKTSIALQILMHNVKRGLPVLFFSLEMSKQSILNRLACQIAEVSVKRFRTGELSDKERGKVALAFEELRELPIYIDDSHALSPSDVRIRTVRAKEEYGIELAELDYIQKMRPDFSRGGENDKLTEICDAMIGIAKDTVPFTVLSQLSREHRKDKRKPDIPDLRGSGSLEAMSHVILFPYREEMEVGKGNDERLKGKAEFLVRKQREGALATINMRFIGWKQMYMDTADAYEDQPEQQDLKEEPF